MRTTSPRTLIITGGITAALVGLLALVIHLPSTTPAASPTSAMPGATTRVATITPTALHAATRSPSSATVRLARTCGNPGTPRVVHHVVWIWRENESFSDVIGSAAAPYQTRLAKRCGLATNFHNESH